MTTNGGPARSAPVRGLRQVLGTGRGRIPAAMAGLWALAAVLAVTQANRALNLPPGRRLADMETWLGSNGVLHLPGSLYDDHGPAFSGTPFAGLVLRPLTRAAEHTLGVAWTVTTLLLVAVVGLLVARALGAVYPGQRAGRRAVLFTAPVVICVLMLSLPVRGNLSLGQISVLPVLLVLPACLPSVDAGRDVRRAAGVAAGVGAALQPSLLLFVPLLWLTGRRGSALTFVGAFALCTAVAGVALPHDSVTYWGHHVAGAGLGGVPDSSNNQSLHGLLLRIGLHGPTEYTLLVLLVVPVVVLGLRRAVEYARDGQPVLATALTGCVAVAAAPVSWQHQQLWVLLAAVGRLGRTTSARLVWPIVVVAVMTVNSGTLFPGSAQAVRVVADNAPLLLALLCACVLPFVHRDSPTWTASVPLHDTAPRAPGRHVPLLPARLRVLSRPNVLLELLVIRAGYQLYSFIRASVPDQRAGAESHGRQVLAAEDFLHVDIEHRWNHFVASVDWLKSAMGFFYESFHFVVPVGLLVFLYVKRPTVYRSARTVLCVATATGLLGFWLYPLAPPRLMPGRGFIDTVHGPQDLANPNFGALTKISNQYAAMPSLHVGWALWSGLVIAAVAPWMWLKVLGLLYPVATTLVVMGTANHYVLDAVGGVAVITFGFLVQYALTGRSAFRAEASAAPATSDTTGSTPMPVVGAMGKPDTPSRDKADIIPESRIEQDKASISDKS